jgi:hypothetical protein
MIDARQQLVDYISADAVFHAAASVEPWLPDPSVFTTVRVQYTH